MSNEEAAGAQGDAQVRHVPRDFRRHLRLRRRVHRRPLGPQEVSSLSPLPSPPATSNASLDRLR